MAGTMLSAFSVNAITLAAVMEVTGDLGRIPLEETGIGDRSDACVLGVFGGSLRCRAFYRSATHDPVAAMMASGAASTPVVLTLTTAKTISGNACISGITIPVVVKQSLMVEFTLNPDGNWLILGQTTG